MGILFNILLFFHIVVCLFLVLLVIMQRPKQEGLGAAFASGMMSESFGAQATDVLQKGTRYLAILFFILSVAMAGIKSREYSSRVAPIKDEPVEAAPATPVAPADAPKSASDAPAPASTAPKTEPATPAPAAKPTTEAPKPAATTPAPAAKPATEAPKPAATTPAPAAKPPTEAPKPAATTPAPAAKPAPAAPKPAAATPAPAAPAVPK
jgi:preprotein translocase subunit SecG